MPNVIVESKNLGHVTAYAYAKSKGYTGTEEEFAELMASYATVAETAGAAAQAAESSAEDSEAYAVGKRNGVDVDSDDPAYQNNSKWYSDQLSSYEDAFYNAYPVEEASGSFISFDDGADSIPLKSLIVNIDPVQAGSGDPAPDNVRPIIGCTQIRIPHTGVNLCGGNTMLAAIELTNPASRVGTDSDGRYYSLYSGNSASNKTYIPRTFFKPNTQYTFILTLKMSGASGSNFNFRIYYTDGTNSGGFASVVAANTKHTKVFTTAANKTVSAVVGYYSNTNTNYLYVDESGIFEGALTAADFVAPVGNMEVIDIPDPPGTVYGGTLDVLTGALTVDRMSYTFDGSSDESWTSSNGCFVTYFLGTAIKRSSLTSGTANIVMCDSYKNGGVKYRDDVVNKTIVKTVGDNNQIALKDTDYESTELFTAHLQESPIQVVYRLATPVVYQLTPRQINTVLGLNNIWTNYGSIFMEYRADIQTYVNEDERFANIYPKDSASGSFVSLPGAAEGMPLGFLIADIEAYQSGSGDPSPTNVRPISGFSAVNVFQTGENLLPLSLPSNAFAGTFATDDTSISSASYARCFCFWVGRNAVLQFQSATPIGTAIAFADSLLTSRTGATIYGAVNVTYRPSYVFNSGSHPYIVICVSNSSALTPGTGAYDTQKTMLSFGSGAKTYSERKDHVAKSVTIPDTPGTVYGGTLDVVSGVLTVDKAAVDLGSLSWTKKTGTQTDYFTANVTGIKPASSATSPSDILCSEYKPTGSTYVSYSAYPYSIGVTSSASSSAIYVQDLRYANKDDFTTAVTGVILVYPLKTPVTYQLNPQEIDALTGTNVIWSDAGDVSVEYCIDFTTYVDKKVSAAQTLMELIITANRESSMKASTAYSAGALIIVNGTLYKATTSIASGATFTVGTNVVATTVAAELAAIS